MWGRPPKHGLASRAPFSYPCHSNHLSASAHRSILCRIAYVPLYFDHIRMDTYERFDFVVAWWSYHADPSAFQGLNIRIYKPSQVGRVLDETTKKYRPEMQSSLSANMGKNNLSQLDLLRQKWPPARALAWYVPCRLVICNGWVWGWRSDW